jgi:hypothetical protein
MLLAPTSDCYRATFSEFVSFVVAYVELLLAAWRARDECLPPRVRPVALTDFYRLGIAEPTLLWMLYQAHIEHLNGAPGPGNGQYKIQLAGNLLAQDGSCFALTEAGEVFADAFLADALVPPDESARDALHSSLVLGRLHPCYDKEARIFSWGRHVLKHFRQPSANQELVLRAAEELVWPLWFDDPLPRHPGQRPKIRCHDTIKDLNRRQIPYFIHFKGDGTGTRIGWEYR